MLELSPKAFRFVDAAISVSKDQHAKALWARFDRNDKRDLPHSVARAALGALEAAELRLRKALASPTLDEDEAAELSNDLGFVLAIETDLRRHLGTP